MRRRREEEGGKPHHGRGRHPCRERRRRSSHSRFEWRHEHARGGYRGGQGGRGRDTHVRTKKLSASASISAKNAANWSRTAVGRRAGAGEGGGWEIGVEQGRVYRHRTWKERTDREGRFHVGKIPIPDSPKLNWTSRRGLGKRGRKGEQKQKSVDLFLHPLLAPLAQSVSQSGQPLPLLRPLFVCLS